MTVIRDSACGALSSDADKAARQLYRCHGDALHSCVARFCPDWASAEDIVQETFIRAWRHLPQLSADDRPVRPWLFRVARNLLIDAERAARARSPCKPRPPGPPCSSAWRQRPRPRDGVPPPLHTP